MFTPNRTRGTALSDNRRSTPRISALKNSSRTSLVRRSISTRSSLNITNASLLASPNVSSAFGSLQHSIEAYESSIPVLVTEAIALADDLSEVSVKISENGWSWLISNQKMFVWSYYQPGASKIPTCKELALRGLESDDNYSAELAAVYCNEDTGALSVLVVSMLGQVMYWPNVLSSIATSYENKIMLLGTQCFNLVSIKKHGFILCSLSSSLFHIFPTQSSIAFKEMNKWEGRLSSIGRRVSSFFFSSTNQENVSQVLVLPNKEHGDYSVLILTQRYIQLWKCLFVSDQEAGPVQFQKEIDLSEVVSPKLSIKIWDCIKPNLHLEPLDFRIATRRGHIALLVAISESSGMDAHMHYAVAVLPPTLTTVDDYNLIIFQHSDIISEMIIEENYAYELMVEDASAKRLKHFMMWSRDRVILKSLASIDGDYHEESVPFDVSGDRVLGVGCCAGKLLIFSAIYGLLTASSNTEHMTTLMLGEPSMDSSSIVPSGSVVSLPGTPSVSQTRMEQLETSGNAAQQLQAAFLHYCKLQLEQAQIIISEAFPLGVAGGTLDGAVATLSAELLDDYPAQDPRWAESVPRDIATQATGSFILLHQLEDKLKAHSLFLKFLSDVGIWDSLSVIGRDKAVTKWLLWEHAEKLHASISLLQNHSSHQTLMDSVIMKVLNHRENVASKAGLTPRDYFYREVTKIGEIFESLLDEEEVSLSKSSLSPKDRATLVTGVNTIMEAVLSCVSRYRKSLDIRYIGDGGSFHEFIPWTVGSGRMGVRSIILQQIKTTIDRGIPEAEDGQQRALLYQSLHSLADLLLEGYLEQIASLADIEAASARKAELHAAYVIHRNQVIRPLLNIGLGEKATALSEKFLDFDMLIRICDETGDEAKLKSYMKRFSSERFSDYLFRWYLDRRDYRKLLGCCGKTEKDELKLFLKGHPHLAWMEQLQSGDLLGAHATLRYLAAAQRDSLNKKKNYLSLSKLAAAFSGGDELEEKIENICQEQLLIKYQEMLPASVMRSLNTEVDLMRVYAPDEIIQLYIDDANEQANEVDFKKAFELLSYLPLVAMDDDDEVDVEEWKMRIWSRLILRDNWADTDTMLDPADACNHTLLFKTAELANTTGLLKDILPNVDALLHRKELAKLVRDPSFKYLMRASFEWMERSIKSSM